MKLASNNQPSYPVEGAEELIEKVNKQLNPKWYASGHTVLVFLVVIVVCLFSLKILKDKCANKIDYQKHVQKK